SGASLNSVEIPASVVYLGEWSFSSCKHLKSLIFADRCLLKSIERGAFRGCASLSAVSFSEQGSLRIIGNEAFYECSAISSLDLPQSLEV
ncbi:leucine-rich repeat domain-containing protein, partial [Escherichia coli]